VNTTVHHIDRIMLAAVDRLCAAAERTTSGRLQLLSDTVRDLAWQALARGLVLVLQVMHCVENVALLVGY